MLETILITILSALVAFLLFFGLTVFYRKTKYYKKQVERSLKMVPFLVTIPQETGGDKLDGPRDQRDVAREFIANAENMYNTLFSIYKSTGLSLKKHFYKFFYRDRHIALELVAYKKEIYFYVVCPYVLVSLVEKAITTHYPEAQIKEVEEHNIFSKERELQGVIATEIYGIKHYHYPIKTYQTIDNEPLEAITNAFSQLTEDEGAALQILIRPTDPKRVTTGKKLAQKIQKGPDKKGSPLSDFARDVVKPGSAQDQKPPEPYRMTPEEEELARDVDRKATKFGFEARIRLIISGADENRSRMIYDQTKSAFAQFSDLSQNGFKFRKAKNAKKTKKIVTDYIFRFFDQPLLGFDRFWAKKRGHRLTLNTEELASLYHLPNAMVKTPGIKWLSAKASQSPVNIPSEGNAFAKTNFRGKEEMVRIGGEDRMRHLYTVGQTGTGKTTLLKTLIINDIMAGNGVCYIDPHGDDTIDIINHIPRERAEDVIIFDPADSERPMGLNLFEAGTTEEKDFVIQEAIQMLYRLYDPGHTGIMGPRFEHWFRNAALALMADPKGGTFIEVPRIFTDDKYLAEKLKYVTDPVVKNFWINEMGQTADFHKSEVLGWFVGKFGAFMTNTTMRNILGQTQSSFNFNDIMDNKKILMIRLSKGVIGEMNMQLLGMIFISKFQMAAMRRASTPKEGRTPFYMYIDEFQNFATDNIAQIFSEARKFNLSLTVANQYISQMREDIRDSVFGNVGTVSAFRVSAEDAEYLEKQFSPEFGKEDLVRQENFNAVLRLMVNGLPSRPFNVTTVYPLPGEDNPEVGKGIIEMARLKYGRPRDVVDAELVEKMNINIPTKDPGGIPRGPGV
ncbi:MAG: TraM recognition domain-containing protein [Patescibacteria group bacterium]|nr:TraM recognition domain-containing protein [Patescibacteria group bacterium]